jgi:Flp pilus assembly pilin Flp
MPTARPTLNVKAGSWLVPAVVSQVKQLGPPRCPKEVNQPMIQYLQCLLFEARDEDGQTMAEYAVVLAVITLIVVAALTALSGAISGELAKVTALL